MTYRPADDDALEDAPPPYEATAPSTSTAVSQHPLTAPAQQHQQYPLLNPSAYQHTSYAHQNDGTTAGPTVYPTENYPPMATQSVAITAPPTAIYTPYPAMTESVASVNNAAPASTPGPNNPQLYPEMPSESAGSSYPVPFSAPPVGHLPQHRPSAPWALLDEPEIPTPAASTPPQSTEYVDEKRTQDYGVSGDLIDLETGWNSSSSVRESSSSPTPTTMANAPAPSATFTPLGAPGLVTMYKCARCGATLESETAVCKRIHALPLSLTEKQIRNATGIDLEERKRSQRPSGIGGSVQETSDGNRASYEGGAYSPAYPVPGSLTTARVVTAANNYGTNDTYLRRTMSVQTPVTALKKLWRDTKKEISHQTSGRYTGPHEL
ncbi:hypothetical protein BGZ99_009476, partial [Dissophora globulifera]